MQRRIVSINKHPVFITLEYQFWECLEDIADDLGVTLQGLVRKVACELGGDISSALRVYVLSHYQTQSRPADRGSQRVYH